MNTKARKVFRLLYRKLLTLYPQSFRERFERSMLQTFDDLCAERQGRELTLAISMATDTGIGIVKEHIFYLSRRGGMRSLLKDRRFAAVIGFLLVVPGGVLFTMLLLGVEPSLGYLQLYLQPTGPDSPHLLGSLIFLGLILFLPSVGVFIIVAATEGGLFQNIIKNLAIAEIVAFALVTPLIALELSYGQSSYSSFPFPLFVILWLLPTLFVLILAPMVRNLRAGHRILANPITLILRLIVLLIIAVFWIGLVNDQMPCFLGVPNCD